MIRLVVFFVSLFIYSSSIYSAKIDTLNVYSGKMDRKIEVIVISPDSSQSISCPVLYLLHGFGGNARTWMNINPNLPEMADRDGVIIVCPDGEKSWYWDSPINPDSQFETFVSKELVEYIDKNYNTIKSRSSRAISGLSMGGHGALWLSIRHKDVFGACGSTSGGVDIRPFPKNWEMSKQIGKLQDNVALWDSSTVINQLDSLKSGDLSIIVDCGTEDFFFDVNNNFHDELLKRGIVHDYIVRPGAHNSAYWSNSIEYQWLFFCKYFKGYRFKSEKK